MTKAIVSRRVDGLKLRSGPRRTSDVLDELAPGDCVNVKKLVGNWAWVIVLKSGKTGYLYEPYLDAPPPKPPIPKPSPVPPPQPPGYLIQMARVAAKKRRDQLIYSAVAVSVIAFLLVLLFWHHW